ncbi:MAG: response regulator [Bacteroidetes bacterium]|nr:response regulator [Bacteroidota bacterium]MCH8523771.1 response regulator [Balneolales bacterium]
MLIQPVIFDSKKKRKESSSYTWKPDDNTTSSSLQNESPVSVRSEIYMPKTLHVEDNAEIRSIVNYFLRKQYDINFAEDGYSALDLVKQEIFDIIIMDINLGEGIDGIETARQIRKIDSYKDVPIIAVTANLSSQVRDHCLQAGMDAFLPKPFRREDLINTINFVLERKSA